MIGYISGKIVKAHPGKILVKLPSGLGYQVFVSPMNRYMTNDQVELYIYESVRESGSELYGFIEYQNYEMVEKLLKVNGVGPKMAALVVYTLGHERILNGLIKADPKVFSEVKGLGAKTAKKIILELKGDVVNIEDIIQSDSDSNAQFSLEFTEALSNLGFKRGEIVSSITKLKKAQDWDEDNLAETIRAGLKVLSKK
jgi:Holliday junction DNA helicase RuvA